MQGKKLTILATSFLITILIFTIGMLLNYSFDFLRINAVLEVMNEQEIGTEAYLTQQDFVVQFGGNKCEVMSERITFLQEEIRTVGTELSTYGRLSFFKKRDFDYLKRRYFLLELRFLMIINQLSSECGKQFLPILFFYEIDDDISERQGYILTEVSKSFPTQVVVLSIDKDYQEEPLVPLLVKWYNITTAPAIIIGDAEHLRGLHYEKELVALINATLTRSSNESAPPHELLAPFFAVTPSYRNTLFT